MMDPTAVGVNNHRRVVERGCLGGGGSVARRVSAAQTARASASTTRTAEGHAVSDVWSPPTGSPTPTLIDKSARSGRSSSRVGSAAPERPDAWKHQLKSVGGE